MRFRIFALSLISAALLAASANAATILQLVIDPASTAGAGVPPSNGFTVSSTQTGAGRWHLFALDNNAGSQGISSYDITVGGASTNLHRSPTTSWNDPDENGPFNAGFSLLRTPNNNGGVFQASQPLPGSVPVLITGFGQTASDFQQKIPQADPSQFQLTTSGQWGNYATISPALGKNWVFIGEGQYTTGTPAIGNAVITTYDSNFNSVATPVCIVAGSETCGLGGGTVNPPIVNDALIDGVHASIPGSVSTTVTQSGGDEPVTWGNFQFVSYTPGFGGSGDGASEAANATFDPNNQLFSWNTVGAPRGQYVWNVDASNAGGSDTGSITVNVTAVPEPATLALVGLALVGFIGLGRRR